MSNFDTNASAVLSMEDLPNFVKPPSATWLSNMAPIATAAGDSADLAQTLDTVPGKPAASTAPAASAAEAPRTLSLHAGAVSGPAMSPVETDGENNALPSALVKTAPAAAAARTI